MFTFFIAIYDTLNQSAPVVAPCVESKLGGDKRYTTFFKYKSDQTFISPYIIGYFISA